MKELDFSELHKRPAQAKLFKSETKRSRYVMLGEFPRVKTMVCSMPFIKVKK